MPKPKSNQQLLTELDQIHAWFPARKDANLWARIAGRKQKVDTLEGEETALKGDYVCLGIENERWPQSKAIFEERYVPTGKHYPKDKRFKEFRQRPDGANVSAARVDHSFKLHTTWGEQTGKAGDFVVKREDPPDIWIVDGDIFGATYKRLA